MDKRLTAAVIVVIVAVIAYTAFIFNTNRDTETINTNTGSQTQSAEPSGETAQMDAVVITYTNDGFEKASYTAKINQLVEVVNNSSRTLEFSSDEHPTHRDNSELNLQELAPGEKATLTVSKAGTWGFHDHLQSDETGTLTIES